MAEDYDAIINLIEGQIAYISLYDSKGEESFIEVSVDELKANTIECKKGKAFQFSVLSDGSAKLFPVPIPSMKSDEFYALVRKYKKEYGHL